MIEPAHLMVCLMGMTLGVLIIALAVLVATVRLCRTLRQVDAILPQCDRLVQQTAHSVGEAGRLLRRLHQTARRLDVVIRQIGTAASGTIEQFMLLRGRARTFFTEHFGGSGNGARSGPRGRDKG